MLKRQGGKRPFQVDHAESRANTELESDPITTWVLTDTSGLNLWELYIRAFFVLNSDCQEPIASSNHHTSMVFEMAEGLRVFFGVDHLSTLTDAWTLGRVKERTAKKSICDLAQLSNELDSRRF